MAQSCAECKLLVAMMWLVWKQILLGYASYFVRVKVREQLSASLGRVIWDFGASILIEVRGV